jgi:MFS transporter, PPP family, 3-phenylpropionic acid transporter
MRISEANKLRIIYFLVLSCTASWLPVLADFCKSRGLSEIQISLILSITPVMIFLVQPFYGMMADKFGYKKTIIIASFLAAVSYLGYLYDAGFTWLIVVTIFMSLFYNTIQPVLDSLSLQLASSNPKFSYGTLRIAGAAGWSFTSIITGQVIDAVNITAIFIISSISMLLVFGFAFLLQNDSREKKGAEENSFKNVSDVIKNRSLIFLLICVFLVSTGATTIWNFYSTYMKENGASASLVGYGLSLQGLCELPLFYFSARIILRLGLRTTLVITVLATAIRLLLYSLIKNPVAALPVEVLHGFSWSLFWVVCVEYINKLVNKNWLATGQSLLYAAYYGIGAIAGNYWTGYLQKTSMKIAEIFLLNAGIVAVVAVSILLFMKNKNKNYTTASS